MYIRGLVSRRLVTSLWYLENSCRKINACIQVFIYNIFILFGFYPQKGIGWVVPPLCTLLPNTSDFSWMYFYDWVHFPLQPPGQIFCLFSGALLACRKGSWSWVVIENQVWCRQSASYGSLTTLSFNLSIASFSSVYNIKTCNIYHRIL